MTTILCPICVSPDLSDGSAKYRNAIALLEAFLAATRRVASGIYFYELAADGISLLRKMVILK